MEKIENLRKTIKNNLIKYRKSAGLTQVQLAEKLGYSDKSVSKWEREEGVPDIYILKEIADLYGVTVNDLISENSYQTKTKDKIKKILSQRNKFIISALVAVALWSIATALYVILDIFGVASRNLLVNIYIYCIPITCLILLVFNSIWGKKYLNLIFISGLIWTMTLSIYVTFPIEKLSELFIIPIPLQILTILGFLFGKNKEIKEKYTSLHLIAYTSSFFNHSID